LAKSGIASRLHSPDSSSNLQLQDLAGGLDPKSPFRWGVGGQRPPSNTLYYYVDPSTVPAKWHLNLSIVSAECKYVTDDRQETDRQTTVRRNV